MAEGLGLFFGAFDGPVVLVGPDLRCLAFSGQRPHILADLFGRRLEVGDGVLDAVPDPARREAKRSNLARALAGELVSLDLEYATPEGGAWYRSTYIPVAAAGAVSGVVVSVRDITDKVRARESAFLKERRLREALDASEIAYWSYDGDTGQAFFSDSWFTMLGYRPGDLPPVLETWIGLLHPEDAEPSVAAFRSFIQTENRSFQLEFRLRTASGGWRWIVGRAQVVERNDRGLPRRVAGTHLDITRRKQMERALVESEARWTTLVDEAPVGITLVGRDGTVQFVNRDAAASLRESAVGRRWKDLLEPELHAPVDGLLGRIFSGGVPETVVTDRPGPDGRLRTLSNHVSLVREPGGASAAVVVSVDITAQRREQRRRARTARRTEILLDLHQRPRPAVGALLDEGLGAAVELTGSAFGSVYRWEPETGGFRLAAWSGNAIALDEPGGAWSRAADERRVLRLGGPGTPDPSLMVLPVFERDRLAAVFGVSGKAGAYDEDDETELQTLVENVWQLSRRQEAERSLVLLSEAVRHSPVSIVITDPRGVLEYVNPRFLEESGFEAGEVLGRTHQVVRSGQVPPETYRALWTAIRAGADWQGELVNRRKDGRLYTVWASISPVRDEEGLISHYVGVDEDITERKVTQEVLARAQKMETVGQLAAGVAHDFNNLLTSVLGYNQMLLRKLEAGNPARLYAERIEVSGRRAAGLVAGLLAVGRQQRLAKAVISLADLLRDEEPLLASLVKPPTVLEILPGPEGWTVEADPGQISQVVVNLVTNARDALAGRGHLRVEAGGAGPDAPGAPGPGRWAWLRVTDDGPGIPPELRDRVFDPFFTTKPIGMGTGLGLSIVQGIVHQHQGAVAVESEPGAGTRMTVWLPAAG